MVRSGRGRQAGGDGAPRGDEFVFGARARPEPVATVSWQTERRGLMILGARPAREMMAGPARPRRLAGLCLGAVIATWDAGAVLALSDSAEDAHPSRQALEREGDHPFFAEDGADHPG